MSRTDDAIKLAAGVAEAIGGLIKIAPELGKIIERGLEAADSESPLGPELRAVMAPGKDTELGAVVDKLRNGR